MKRKCDYCDVAYQDTLEKCPNCGAPNEHIRRVADDIPKTIEELKEYCNKHQIPTEKLRFYIGENYEGPKAFGIYKDETTGNFVVYKCKSDGSKAIRYSGDDEAYAVYEIYAKLKEVALLAQKPKASSRPVVSDKAANSIGKFVIKGIKMWVIYQVAIMVVSLVVIGGAFLAAMLDNSPATGYYEHNDKMYYYYSDDWYRWNEDSESWVRDNSNSALDANAEDYYYGGYYSSDDISSFQDSSWYSEPSYDYSNDWDDNDWDNDWDDDWDDSWSDSYDWDSDW